jgi:integrase
LRCPPTKDLSRQAANDWWSQKQAEIDKDLGEGKRHPVHVVEAYRDAIENHRLYGKWHRKYGNQDEAERADKMADWLQAALASDNPSFPLTKFQEDPRYKHTRYLMDEDLAAAELLWFDRFNTIRKEEKHEKPTPAENTIRTHIDQFLELKRAQAQAKGKVAGFSSYKQWIEVFKNWVDPQSSLEAVNEDLWERYFLYLSGRVAKHELSPATAKDYIGAARSFIRSRWERRLIDLPRNLTSRQLAICVPIKDPITFSVEEVKRYLQAARDRTRLYLLLFLNCGMYPQDVSCLTQDEVNWEEGRITRKRTKTRNRSENVPKVDYLLWRDTFNLLKAHRSNHPTLVLLNEDGKPLLTERESKNGKLSRNQNIQFAYRRLQEKMKVEGEAKKGLKAFRKTGATLLEQSQYGRFAEHYLGEAPSTIASRHYAHKNGAEFDEAIKWLGQQLGLE